jgi:hypothetical protein
LVLAAAAAVLVVVSAWLLRPGTPPDNPIGDSTQQASTTQPAPSPEKPGDESPDLSEAVSEVGSAVVSAATRTTDAAAAQGRAFLPLVPSAPMPSFSVSTTMEPTRSLKEAGQGVSDGLAPVTDSARRAVDLFIRDLSPMGLEDKTGF